MLIEATRPQAPPPPTCFWAQDLEARKAMLSLSLKAIHLLRHYSIIRWDKQATATRFSRKWPTGTACIYHAVTETHPSQGTQNFSSKISPLKPFLCQTSPFTDKTLRSTRPGNGLYLPRFDFLGWPLCHSRVHRKCHAGVQNSLRHFFR